MALQPLRGDVKTRSDCPQRLLGFVRKGLVANLAFTKDIIHRAVEPAEIKVRSLHSERDSGFLSKFIFCGRAVLKFLPVRG